ncbi:hypothetical protein ACFW0I_36275 [[Kitasatospora] papulosa]|uniref:hypothetical protein n=1 Tax=[Kitasatospora] papulosa TaxID=1464011 RepID=UPI0036CE3B6C
MSRGGGAWAGARIPPPPHGDPADWSEADFEAYENIARADELHTEPELPVFIGKARAGMGAASAAAIRELVMEVRAA